MVDSTGSEAMTYWQYSARIWGPKNEQIDNVLSVAVGSEREGKSRLQEVLMESVTEYGGNLRWVALQESENGRSWREVARRLN